MPSLTLPPSVRRILGGVKRRSIAVVDAARGKPAPTPAAPAAAAAPEVNILDWYTKEPPSPANAVGIFAGEWASRYPAPLQDLEVGVTPLFDDSRVSWFIDRLSAGSGDDGSDGGGIAGASVLELGPLEGGHSYMLERAGVAYVLAIESNARAFLKCLVTKELLGLDRTSFEFGDFVPYLRRRERTFDVSIASGVIDHLREPGPVIADLCAATSQAIFVWSQYVDDEVIAGRPELHRKFGDRRTVTVDGADYQLVEYRYLDALDEARFCGGGAPTSSWLTLDGLLGAFSRNGFGAIEILSDDRQHPNGPAITFLARRSGEVVSEG